MSENSIISLCEKNQGLCREIKYDQEMLALAEHYANNKEIHCGKGMAVAFMNGNHEICKKLKITEKGGLGHHSQKAKSGASMIMLGVKKMLSARIDENKEKLKENQLKIDKLISEI